MQKKKNKKNRNKQKYAVIDIYISIFHDVQYRERAIIDTTTSQEASISHRLDFWPGGFGFPV
jgi:hypothetical protein